MKSRYLNNHVLELYRRLILELLKLIVELLQPYKIYQFNLPVELLEPFALMVANYNKHGHMSFIEFELYTHPYEERMYRINLYRTQFY